MNTLQRILSFVELELIDDGTPLDPDAELLVSGMVDSLGLMRLIAFIGDDLGIDVPHGDIVIENFRTVSTIDAYLRSLEPT